MIISQTLPDYDRTRVIERPDGFYWQDKLTDELLGPFATLLEAEIGIADWIDPQTGEPAEELQPRLRDE